MAARRPPVQDIPAPAGAIGCVGMVAMLRRVRAQDVGRIVVVRKTAGWLPALNPMGCAVFGWRVVALRGRIVLQGRGHDEFCVADASLVRLTCIEPRRAEAYAIARARRSADESLEELARALRAPPMTEKELAEAMLAAGTEAVDAHLRGFVGLPLVR